MNKQFSSDRPISKSEDDKFQRYEFSKRIAHTIIEREDEECIAIGIYGEWGEGKTSVLNFIESELKNQENIIYIKFNPWRYNDESGLLFQFFQKLSNALNTHLKTSKERIGELLTKYSKLLNFSFPVLGGNIGEVIETTGGLLGNVDIETLKERIETILRENGKKIVVFIDDIDRLDKAEIHTIFRLVKLTADFSYTTYILSFDEDMVSSAIGERFGEGNQQAGKNFLEKIIQVPLKIPLAQPEALKQFCFELVEHALIANKIQLTDEEGRRFVKAFSSDILIRLNTPRLAVRYGNTLSFSLPLLAGEVNIIDLMLIEAVKIFFPRHYELIKTHPEYFIGSYPNSAIHGKHDDKIKLLEEHLNNYGDDLTKRENTAIKNLLIELFPRLNEAFLNHGGYQYRTTTEWFKNKRIVSPKYFSRFFSYAVMKGDLSDVAFHTFLFEIANKPIETVATSIRKLVEQSSPDSFIHKARSLEEEFSWEISIKLAKAITIISEVFPKRYGNFFYGYNAPNGQAAIFIYQLIKKHGDNKEQLILAKELIDEAKPIEFAFELDSWLMGGKSDDEKLFSAEQEKELAAMLVKRSLKEAGNEPLFEKFPNQSRTLFSAWSEIDKSELTIYLQLQLNKNPRHILGLLRAFTPTVYSSSRPDPYKSDFTKEEYEHLISIFDKNEINKLISQVYSEEKINAEKPILTYRQEKEQTDLNIARQFRKLLLTNNSVSES